MGRAVCVSAGRLSSVGPISEAAGVLMCVKWVRVPRIVRVIEIWIPLYVELLNVLISGSVFSHLLKN